MNHPGDKEVEASQDLPLLQPQQGKGRNVVLSKSALKSQRQRANYSPEKIKELKEMLQ